MEIQLTPVQNARLVSIQERKNELDRAEREIQHRKALVQADLDDLVAVIMDAHGVEAYADGMNYENGVLEYSLPDYTVPEPLVEGIDG